MGINRHHISLLMLLFGSSAMGQSIEYYVNGGQGFQPGSFVVTTAGPSFGVFIEGSDWTANCVAPYCNDDTNTGTDELEYNVILGYSPGPMENQWLFFNLFGTLGVDTVDAVFAIVPGLASTEVGGFFIGYGPDTGLADFTGLVAYVDNAPGDFDGDGALGCADIDELVQNVANATGDLTFDVNSDGLVDAGDVDFWISSLFGTLPADANLDGVVDGSDFIAWSVNKFQAGGGWCGGDFGANGFVDGEDLLIWNNNKFTIADGVHAVPEPSSVFLILCGLILGRRTGA